MVTKEAYAYLVGHRYKKKQKKHWHYHYCMTTSMQQKYKIIWNNDKKYRIRNTKKKRFMVDEEKYFNANNNNKKKLKNRKKNMCKSVSFFLLVQQFIYLSFMIYDFEQKGGYCIIYDLITICHWRGISEALSCIKWVCLVITFNILAPQLIFISSSYIELFNFCW